LIGGLQIVQEIAPGIPAPPQQQRRRDTRFVSTTLRRYSYAAIACNRRRATTGAAQPYFGGEPELSGGGVEFMEPFGLVD